MWGTKSLPGCPSIHDRLEACRTRQLSVNQDRGLRQLSLTPDISVLRRLTLVELRCREVQKRQRFGWIDQAAAENFNY